jgi:hypothetical protein
MPRCITLLLAATFIAGFLRGAEGDELTRSRREFLEAFQKIPAATEVSTIVLPGNWIPAMEIHSIDSQYGKWLVWMEKGASVFSIYPYYDEKEVARFGGVSCVVIKLDADRLTVDDMVAAFQGHRKGSPLHLIEYSVSYPDGRHFHTSKTEANKLLQTTPRTVTPSAAAGSAPVPSVSDR